ncbi:hypothetical protein RhiTH_002367 [Rhizoctonia solani]
MSEAMIKRWNEITMDHSEGPAAASSSKRSRPRAHSQSSSNESEDNISIVSRSPSPAPRNDKEEDISVYDQYIRGPILEPVTVNTKISSSNKGFGMLAKMGWKEGEGLGASGQGERTLARNAQGDVLNNKNQDEAVAAKEQIKTEVNDILRSFYCTDCEKQYKNVAQFDEHVRSYAHTHVVRMKEQQATARQRQSGESAARKAKEKKREEKEMKKMAAAAGIKYSSGSATSSSIVVPAQPTIKPVAINSGGGFAPVSDPPARRGGWSAVTAPTESTGARSFAPVSATTVTPVGLKKTGWTAVANPAISSSIPTAGAESQDPKQSAKKMGGGFMRGGWTTLDTGTSADQDIEMASPVTVSSKRVIPPPPTDPAPLPPPPPPTLDPPPPPPEDVPPPPPPSHPAPNGWWPSR